MTIMQIYFAGSIRGGTFEGKPEAFRAIVKTITDKCALTVEHGAVTGKPEILDDPAIFKRDMQGIKDCHAMIAEITAPSIGVGYEIRTAEDYDLPILCLYHASIGKPSAVIAGNKDSTIRTVSYTSNEELPGIINSFLNEVSYEYGDFE